ELSDVREAARALFLASELAWFPVAAKEPFVSFGESLLGKNGMDVGLLDNVDNHQPVRADEREAFFQMLAATGRIDAAQLAHGAARELPEYVKFSQRNIRAEVPQGRLLARE